MSEWHGWGDGTVAMHIGTLPGRKSVCLYKHEGSVVRTLAYFRDEADAREAMAIFDTIILGKEVTDE